MSVESGASASGQSGAVGINGGASGADQHSVVDGESETERESDDEFGRDSNARRCGWGP